MMVQMVDTVSWIKVLIHEAQARRSDEVACRDTDNTVSDWSAAHGNMRTSQACRLESFDDV